MTVYLTLLSTLQKENLIKKIMIRKVMRLCTKTVTETKEKYQKYSNPTGNRIFQSSTAQLFTRDYWDTSSIPKYF